MRREISSSNLTHFYQSLLLILLFIGFLTLSANISQISKNWFESTSYFLAYLAIWVAILRLFFGLKRVEIVTEKKGLIVQSASGISYKRVLIPMTNIKNVSQVFLMNNPEIVTIELKIPCDFGKKIRFIPEFRFLSFGEHPIVEELNRKVAQLN